MQIDGELEKNYAWIMMSHAYKNRTDYSKLYEGKESCHVMSVFLVVTKYLFHMNDFWT